MIAYAINYEIKGKEGKENVVKIDAKDIKSAKKKIGKKHGYKDGRMIKVLDVSVIGYY